MDAQRKVKLKLEDLRVESFVTSSLPRIDADVVGAGETPGTTFCTSNTCDGAGTTCYGCGWTYCCEPFTECEVNTQPLSTA